MSKSVLTSPSVIQKNIDHLKSIKAKPYEDPKHPYTPKGYKPHQSRFAIPRCSITSQTETDLLIIESKIHTNNRPINLMVDSGATKDFISKSFVITNSESEVK